MAAPTFQAVGSLGVFSGAATIAWPAHQADDIGLLILETCGGEPISLSTANGFAAVTNSPQATGTTTDGTQLTMFWCRATSSAMGSPVTTDSGDHNIGLIVTFRGCKTSGNPWDVTAGSVKATASTTTTFPSVTTTVADCRIVLAATRDTDSNAAAWSALTNANLASLTEHYDAGSLSGNGGGIHVGSGTKAAAGSTGTTTATVSSSINAMMTVALAPPASGVTGSGAMTAANATLSGAGTLRLTGSGAMTTANSTLTGAGTLALTGSGAMIATNATLLGSGTVGNVITGTGSMTATAAVLTGPANLKLTGSGAMTAADSTLSGFAQVGPVLGGVMILGNVNMWVEIAWGADLLADPATWTWTDVTEDVRAGDGKALSITIGRADEASTAPPAICKLTLDNSSGDYSLGGQSINWPNVRRNTPVRVRADPPTGSARVIFQGYADGFTPDWNTTGSDATVSLSASGVTRRLRQGASPVKSALRRALEAKPAVQAYWPLEDGVDAKGAAGYPEGTPPMWLTGSGEVKFATNTTFPASAPLPVLDKAGLGVWIPGYDTVSDNQLRFLIRFADAPGEPDDSVIARMHMTGGTYWSLLYGTGGSLKIQAHNRLNTLIGFWGPYGFDVDGKALRVNFEVNQVGANAAWGLGTVDDVPNTQAAYISDGTGALTIGTIASIELNVGQTMSNSAFGHVTIENVQSSIFDTKAQLQAWAYDQITSFGDGRLWRLATENDVGLTLYDFGGGGGGVTTIDRMGPQRVDTLLNLLRQAETADQGVLWDGKTPGLSYTTRRYFEWGGDALVVAASDLTMPFNPTDDDQRTRNKVTVTRSGGSSHTTEDVDGPLGTAVIGKYDTSLTVNTYADEVLPFYSAWLVHLGTIEGYRFPRLSLNLAAVPQHINYWMDVIPGSRLDVTNPQAEFGQLPRGTISLIVEGYTMTIDRHHWDVQINCSPWEPWRVGVLATDSGYLDTEVLRLDTEGSTLQASVTAGATSISVTTTSGLLWTTVLDDFPYDIDIGGVKATVTACVDATSPQVMTVSALPLARTAGLPVQLHKPTALGL